MCVIVFFVGLVVVCLLFYQCSKGHNRYSGSKKGKKISEMNDEEKMGFIEDSVRKDDHLDSITAARHYQSLVYGMYLMPHSIMNTRHHSVRGLV